MYRKVNKYIRLEIAMNIAKSVESVDSHNHLAEPQNTLFFFNGANGLQKLAQISTWTILHCEVKAFLRLERIVHLHKEVTFAFDQDALLVLHVFLFALHLDQLLIHLFERHFAARGFMFNKINLTKRPFAEQLLDVKVAERHF